MTTYTLTINTDELGLGVIDGGKVVVTRKRATVADQYPPISALYEITTATADTGIATTALKADDSSTYHECMVWDEGGAVVYRQSFSMPPEACDLHNLSDAVFGSSDIQFKDDGTNRGTPSTTRNVNFTGQDVSATFSGETLTVAVDSTPTVGAAITAHNAASDPHGDRAYINTRFGVFRKIYVMDYIDSSQWAYIDSGNTASQNSTLIATGLAAAIAATQAKKTELELAAGIFLTDMLAVSGFDNSMISGCKGAMLQLKNTQATLMEIRNSNNSEINGIIFLGTATADGVYRDHSLLDIRNGSGFITVKGCDFKDFATWGIVGRLLTGSTYTEGLTILDCGFYDAPSYHASFSAQAGIALGSDGEYSLISGCRFYRIPGAIRLTDGANSRIVNNRIMQLNGGSGALQVDRACIYAEYTGGGNGGKLDISNNTINHNDTGLIPIIVRQNPSQPQNSIMIHDNYMLVNGNASVGYQIVGYDCYDLSVRGNIMRPATAGVNPNLRLNDCDGARVTDNDFRDGTYGLELNSSVDVQYGHNSHNGQTVGKINLLSSSTIKNRNNRSFSLRITSAGAASTPWDESGWTVAKTGTGNYTITHDIGTTNYSAIIQQDNDATPDGLDFSSVRTSSTLDIYIANGGVLTDANVVVVITIGHTNEYSL